MHPASPDDARRRVSRTTVAFVAFAAIAGFFLVAEHRAHVVGYLPWLLLLACPLLHLFMHRGHGGHHGAHERSTKEAK
jgi:hypothetical protein